MKRFLLFLILYGVHLFAVAQTDSSVYDLDSIDLEDSYVDEELAAPDTFQNPIVRQISPDSFSVLKNQKAFAYMEYADSFFRNQKTPVEKIVDETPSDNTSIFSNAIVRTIYWLLAFAGVGFIVWRLLAGRTAIFRKNRRFNVVASDDDHQSVVTENIDAAIQQAISQENYRLAIRYLYLKTLSVLGDKSLLTLAPQKTNYQYVQELRGKRQQPEFSKLTMQYEYAWYGGFQLNQSRFNTIHNNFQTFIRDNS